MTTKEKVAGAPELWNPEIMPSPLCPGCWHGTISALIGDVLDEMKLADRTIMVSGAGCAALAMAGFPVDRTWGAHGRPPDIATGVKRIHPEAIVFTMQGDGDLLAIGSDPFIGVLTRGEMITIIMLNNTNFGTTGGDVASWFFHYGSDRAGDILSALQANDVRIVDGNSTALRLVATGQADICFTDTDDVYAGQRNGWPVAMNALDQAGDGALTIPNTVALLAHAPHPDQARRLIDFLLSCQVEAMLAQSDSHNTPLHPDVRQQFPQYGLDNPLAIDYEKVAETLPLARQRAAEILQ